MGNSTKAPSPNSDVTKEYQETLRTSIGLVSIITKKRIWRYFLLAVFTTAILVTVVLLIAIACLHRLDPEFTQMVRLSYICYALAATFGLLIALWEAWKHKWRSLLAIVAIWLFLFGMFFQLMDYIS